MPHTLHKTDLRYYALWIAAAALVIALLANVVGLVSQRQSIDRNAATLTLVKHQQAQLAAAQASACKLRRAGRANTNQHERIPLKAALDYLASLGQKSTKDPDPKRRKAAKEFVERFERYADAVQPLPNPSCPKPASKGGT